MDTSAIMGFINKIEEHGKTGHVAFLMYELLKDAGYSDEEIHETGTALSALVPLMRVG